MKKLLHILIVALALVFFTTGCGSWRATTYKSTSAVVITADTAMKAWAEYVATGKATDDQQRKVKDAFGKYQVSMLAVIDAGKAATANSDQSALQRVVAAASAAQADLVAIINSFIPKPVTK